MDLYTQWGVEITRHRWHIAWEKQVIRGEGRTKEGRYCQSQRTEGTDGGMTWNKIRALGRQNRTEKTWSGNEREDEWM